MSEPNHTALLARAAVRARERPEYLGWVLVRYVEAEKKTDQDMANMLGVSMLDYHRLQLCLRPRAQSFSSDVAQIAIKFGRRVSELAKVIRHVEVLQGMKEESAVQASSGLGLLMAARVRSKGAKTRKKGKNHGSRTKS
jgi:hypothetical protein